MGKNVKAFFPPKVPGALNPYAEACYGNQAAIQSIGRVSQYYDCIIPYGE
jgi:hypothetical protein